MTDPTANAAKAIATARYLRRRADEAAETMGSRRRNLDALADLAEVVATLATGGGFSPEAPQRGRERRSQSRP